jgi:hypothetical protein
MKVLYRMFLYGKKKAAIIMVAAFNLLSFEKKLFS